MLLWLVPSRRLGRPSRDVRSSRKASALAQPWAASDACRVRVDPNPRSWFLRLLPGVLARASVRAAANGGPGSVADGQGGMRIRAGVAPAAARLERSGYGPDCDFACAISDPEPSPQPIVMSGSGRLRRFCDDETWIDRGATSIYGGAAIEAHVVYGGAARRSYGPRAIGTSFGTLRISVARSRSSSWPSLATKVARLQVFPAMARPGLEPGTPRFSGSRHPVVGAAECLQMRGFKAAIARRRTVSLGRFPARLGLHGGSEVPTPAALLGAACQLGGRFGPKGLMSGAAPAAYQAVTANRSPINRAHARRQRRGGNVNLRPGWGRRRN